MECFFFLTSHVCVPFIMLSNCFSFTQLINCVRVYTWNRSSSKEVMCQDVSPTTALENVSFSHTLAPGSCDVCFESFFIGFENIFVFKHMRFVSSVFVFLVLVLVFLVVQCFSVFEMCLWCLWCFSNAELWFKVV